MADRVWETGFEQIGKREIDRDATPWRVIDTYRVWLKYKGRVYHERVFWEHDWKGPPGGESAPDTNPEDLYGLVRSAINNLKDRATTFRVPGEEVPPFDGEDPPPYGPTPKPYDQYHQEGECWCEDSPHEPGVCPGCGKQLGPSEGWHYHGH